MDKKLTLKKWDADKTGVSVTAQGIHIHAELYGQESNGILLYDKTGADPIRLDFTEEMRAGHTYNCLLTGISPKQYTYLFHEDKVPVMDAQAKACVGHRLFGAEHMAAGDADLLYGCSFVSDHFDWRGDQKPGTPYEDSIYYGMHVRGFTKSASSRIKEAGTFAGVQKKIPYLKNLGVTGIVLQPVYEFMECMVPPEIRTSAEALKYTKKNPELHVNYWGYQSGFYYAPKNAYAYSDDAVSELKTLVKALHKNGLEVILQFYFDHSMSGGRINEILKYWAKYYHIDGFELLGAYLPLKDVASDPAFAEIKLWCEGFPYEEIAELKTERARSYMIGKGRRARRQKDHKIKQERFLASCNKEYKNTVRQFLKGDGNMVSAFLTMQRDNPEDHGKLNFLASYDGFRLADMVSYDRKHNEANGENNNDGENNNFSWNCGVEGETRKKNILSLRTKQMKNALTMLFTAQGTPCLFMGDEWGKSSNGNNNPYCQDNDITWQKWNLKKTERELLTFTEKLIALRKKYGTLHQPRPLQLMDTISCGYPDLSYHGREAWRPDFGYDVRQIGMMLCGRYIVRNGREEDHLFIAYNMHWEEKMFALPKLEKEKRWKLILNTEESPDLNDTDRKEVPVSENTEASECRLSETSDAGQENPELSVTLPGRSVRIYSSEKIPVKGKRKR